MLICRRTALVLTLGALAMPASAEAPWPDRMIRLVVPYPPGSVTDYLARLIADRMGRILNQTIITENRSGGGSSIGTSAVANAPADGYTFLIVAIDFSINQTLLAGRVSYDALRGFEPVSFLAWSPTVLAVHPTVAAQDLAGLIALAKKKPGSIRFASGGIGTGAHMAFELFSQTAGIEMTHVPYRGVAPALVDLLGGNVDAMFVQAPNAQPYIESGKLRALATPNPARLATLPNVPTFAELGWPAVNVPSWFGLVAKAGTPPEVIGRVNEMIASILRDPEIDAQLSQQGMTANPGSPSQFGDLIRSEIARWEQVIKRSGIKLEE